VCGQRLESLAIETLRLAPGQSEHQRLAGTIDVGVEDSDAGTGRGQGKRDVDGGGRLADATFSGGNRDDILCPRQGDQRALHDVRHYRRHDLRLDGEAGEGAHRFHDLRPERICEGSRGKTDRDPDPQRPGRDGSRNRGTTLAEARARQRQAQCEDRTLDIGDRRVRHDS
jgi:hypothetical protein